MVKLVTHDTATGQLKEVTAATAGGASNAGKVPELDGNGRLTSDMMPTGIGADVSEVQASEALAAGDFVNIWSSTGFRVRKADGSASGKHAHGFVRENVAMGAQAKVHFEGLNDQVTGMTPGDVFLSGTTAGQTVATPPTGTGKISQRVGVAVSATSINVEIGRPVILA